MIIPEIEVPGHSFSAVKSYPWLCCTGSPTRNPGHQKDLYCAGNEDVFEFIENVLSEVIELFPAPYVHIGGDEAPKDRWRVCPKCQERIRQEGLHDEEELQGYFNKRIASFLRSSGRSLIGWEEILDGGPSEDSIIHWWRNRTHGCEVAKKAAQQGHRVIASPNRYCYLNFPVSPNQHFKPERTSDLAKVYAARYIPEGLSPEAKKNIIGAECCVWTEYLTEQQVDRMLFPKILACAELMWSYPEKRDINEFLKRVEEQRVRWKTYGVVYGPAFSPG